MKRTKGYHGWMGLAASVLVLGLVLSSCKREVDPSDLEQGGEDLISFTSQIGEAAEQQAASKTGTAPALKSKSSFANGDKMGFFLSLSSGDLVMDGNTHGKFKYDNLQYTYGNNTFSPAKPVFYPYRTTQVDLWGIYPRKDDVSNLQANAYPFTVEDNQTTDLKVIASDLLVATTEKVTPNNTSTTVSLNFEHKMTLLQIKIELPDDLDGKTLHSTTPITNFYIDGLKVDAAINLNEGTVAPATGKNAVTMRPYFLGNRTINSKKLHFYQAIVVPQTVAQKTRLIRLEVKYNDNSAGLFLLELDQLITFLKGTIHTLEVGFDTKKRLRLNGSGKVKWDAQSEYNNSSNVFPGENKTVIVGDVVWATGFLVADGTTTKCKIGTPNEAGLFFQFGSLVGRDNTGAVKVKPNSVSSPTWNSCYYTATGTNELSVAVPTDNPLGNGTGDACRYYLGSSWRMPTSAELFSLTGKTTAGSYNFGAAGVTGMFENSGAWWGANFATKDLLIAPFMHHGGSLSNTPAHVPGSTLVWSGTLNSTNSKTLSFTNTAFTLTDAGERKQGGAIRCVWIRKIYLFDNPELKGTTPGTLRFGFNFPCKWEITNKPAWLTLDTTTGTATVGNATIAVKMTATGAGQREVVLTLKATDSNTGKVENLLITVKQTS